VDLSELIDDLTPLLDDVQAHADRIQRLLLQSEDLAEAQVARFLIGSRLEPAVLANLASLDPRQRLAGLELLRLGFPRSRIGALIKPYVKDAHPTVRSRARRIVAEMALQDVALPDNAWKPPWGEHPRIGKYNPTGWSYGLFLKRPSRPEIAQEHGLPPLSSAADVAALCGIAAVELRALMRPGEGLGSPYVSFEIAKADGRKRRIDAPRAALKRVQRKILEAIVRPLPVHASCHGFVPTRSVVTNARPHRGAHLVVKMDLHDFFPSIHYRRVKGFFMHVGYGHEVAAVLAGLCTHRAKLADGTVLWPGRLPQGAPTSPALANRVAKRLDARLAGLAERTDAAYTRYADDLTFSWQSEGPRLGRFFWWVDQICTQEGFVENVRKRRVLRRGGQQRVTGIVVNDGLSVPRRERKRFRAILHNCRKHGVASQARGRHDFADYLRGFAAYVHMVQPALGTALIAEVDQVLRA
jgi:RNA-directed DNA polymerase